MATSGSTNVASSRDEIIKRALRIIGVLGIGETPSTSQVSDAAIALEHMVKAWAADGMSLWAITKTNFSMTASVASYTIGNSQTINTPKPHRIIQAFNRNTSTNIDTPMLIIPKDIYWRLGNKTSTGTPIQLFYDPQRSTGIIYLFPTPNATAASSQSIHIIYQRPFEDFDAASNEPDFPYEWFEALAFGLAARVAPEYGLPIEERAVLWKEAQFLKDEVLSMGGEEGSISFQRDQRYW